MTTLCRIPCEGTGFETQPAQQSLRLAMWITVLEWDAWWTLFHILYSRRCDEVWEYCNNLLLIYCTTWWLSPCRDMTPRTSPAAWRQEMLCCGQYEVIAENRRFKSSLCDNSSDGDICLHRRTSVCQMKSSNSNQQKQPHRVYYYSNVQDVGLLNAHSCSTREVNHEFEKTVS